MGCSMAVYLGSDKVGVTKELGTDRLQWKCDNMKSLQYEFLNYTGTDFSFLNGLDTSQVKTFNYMFQNCRGITDNAPVIDVSSATNLNYMFYQCQNLTEPPKLEIGKNGISVSLESMFDGCNKLTKFPDYDFTYVTSVSNMFRYCRSLTGEFVLPYIPLITYFGGIFQNCENLNKVRFENCSKGTNFGSVFYACTNLHTIENMDCVSATSDITSSFTNCTNLTNLYVYNIKRNITIGSGTSYGHLLTLDSLVNTIKELWDFSGTTTTRKLTMSTPSKELIANVYVKLVEPTAEQIEADSNIIYKKNCVVCESTDEGAMTLTEYATSKNWAIA